MKRYIFIVLTFAALLSASCEKSEFLNRTPYSTSCPDNFYQDKETQFKLVLTGCYEAINANKVAGVTVTYGTFWQGLQWILGCPSDEIGTTSTAVPYTMANATFLESDNGLVSLWSAYFHGIYRCNELLSHLDIYTGDNKIEYEGETRFLRAFYYYHLALVFGALPIVETNSSGTEARSPLKDVYALIIEDLEFAYNNLDKNGILNQTSANKYTAAAYLARVCNYLAACKRNNVGASLLDKQPLNSFEWVDADAMSRKALNAAKDIIENSSYKLTAEYHMLFRETTKAEQYEECLFMADLPLSGSEGSWPAAARMAAPSGSANTPQVYGGVLIPNPLQFYMYDKTDPRRDHNFTCANTGKESDGTVIMEEIGGYYYPKPNLNRSTSSTWKLLYDSPSQTFNPGVNNYFCAGKYRLVKKGVLQHSSAYHALSYPLMRLADVYLMAAEAEYFVNGDVDEARKYMRAVVLRAAGQDESLCDNLMSTYQRSDFIDELLEHRQRELIFEFSRKTDLIRFGRMDEAIAAMSTTTAVTPEIQALYPTKTFTPYSSIRKAIENLQANWAPHKIWAPISSAQIAVNQNLEQNAGW